MLRCGDKGRFSIIFYFNNAITLYLDNFFCRISYKIHINKLINLLYKMCINLWIDQYLILNYKILSAIFIKLQFFGNKPYFKLNLLNFHYFSSNLSKAGLYNSRFLSFGGTPRNILQSFPPDYLLGLDLTGEVSAKVQTSQVCPAFF